MAIVRINNLIIEGTEVLGTTKKFIIIVNTNTLSNATITIEDPNGAEKISDAGMSQEALGVYTYEYQTAYGDQDGTWLVTIEATDGTHTTVIEKYFEMVDQERYQ